MESSTITLPIYDFINILIGVRSNANVSKQLADMVKAADPHENFCHVEYPGDREGDEFSILVPRVWYKKDWQTSIEKYTHDKKVAGERRLKSVLRSEKITELTGLIKTKLPSLEEKLARNLATAIIDRGNLEAAKQFGIEAL